ncbi:transglutaminase domain-containing protein [Leptolyngbya sp. AN02str]|uniref:transglutaminase domain-containing protein n=1 Tax=Leptolyngbya sp. AN02str TaxID=3423363 RepID=UPI003D322480
MLLESTAPTPPNDGAAIAPSRTIRPMGLSALGAIAFVEGTLWALDPSRGYLTQIDPKTDSTKIINTQHTDEFLDATGLSVSEGMLWLTKGTGVYCCPVDDWTPKLFVSLPYPADGVAVWRSTVYVSCQKAGYIIIFDRNTKREITRFSAPGVGMESLTIRDEELWVCDDIEQSVYCMDRATGEVQFSILTPFRPPKGLAFDPSGTLYVAYMVEEGYVRDNPNTPDYPYELSLRDRLLIHPLHFRYDAARRCTLSNGFLLEMSYVEELAPLEDAEGFEVENLEWRIALPAETDRQIVRQVEPIGLPFTEEIQAGQRVAVFTFDKLSYRDRHLFGWKALIEVRGIKYQLTYEDAEQIPPLPVELQSRYLVDDDDLAMDNPVIQQAAREAIGTETNLLRKMLKIRNYVYDRLSYGLTVHIDTPDVVLERGIGSCGEYVGLLLALARLNGIACRTVGRYKCPPFGDRQGLPLEPDYNHVWIEFYIPGFGWLPMESNVDDVVEGGPYPTRFFMGLPWWHAELSKGIPFETITTLGGGLDLALGDLSINHIRFTILGELPPP